MKSGKGVRRAGLAGDAFLHRLAERGTDPGLWLASLPRMYPCVSLPGDLVHLALERDPLRILQMGTLFDTCLSMDGVNAFSTVANACDLNKRIIYATNATGAVVGRQLLAITSDWYLVGFHIYTTLDDTAVNDALRAIFRDYATAFAAQCQLPLADHGTVPCLLARDWYDDGCVSWAVPAAATT